MNNRLLLATTLLLSGFSLTGCEIYKSNLVPPKGGDGGGDCGGDGQAPCRPDPSTSSDADATTAEFVLQDLQLNQTDGNVWRDVGLNLDGKDTQAPAYAGDCTGVSGAADGNGGRDNQFGSLLWPLIRGTLPALECEVQEAHATGHGALVVSMSGWSGELNDSRVSVNIQPSLDATSDQLVASDCDDVIRIGDSALNGEIERYELHTGDMVTPRPEPAMDGNDSVCLNAEGRANGNPTSPVIVEDTNAYVANGTIVFRLTPGTSFILFADRSSVPILLNQGVLLIPMSADFQTIVDGNASGRFPLAALSNVGPQIGLCDPAGLEDTYRTFADILASEDADADGTVECNALSVGVRFQGVRVNVVGVSADAVSPFYGCDSIGALGLPIVEFPVEACCDSLNGSDVLACNSYWNP